MAQQHTKALFYLLPGQESTNVAGDGLRLGGPQVWVGTQDYQTLSLIHVRNPRPWCDDFSMAKKKKPTGMDTKARWLAQGLWGQILSVPPASF